MRLIILSMIVALLFPASVQAQVNKLATFSTGNSELRIWTDKYDTSTKGGLGIIIAGKGIAFIFDKKEWASLIDIWEKAKAAQSPNWQKIGDLVEGDGALDAARLIVDAGLGIRFTLTEPGSPRATFTITKNDFAKLDAALRKAAQVIDFAGRQ